MIKKVDIILNTYLTEKALLDLINEYLGEVILYNIENVKADTKEDAIKEFTNL